MPFDLCGEVTLSSWPVRIRHVNPHLTWLDWPGLALRRGRGPRDEADGGEWVVLITARLRPPAAQPQRPAATREGN